MTIETFTDEHAVELLKLLVAYFSATEFETQPASELTVAELAGDLIDSLPRGVLPEGMDALKPDSLTMGLRVFGFDPTA